MKRRCRAVLANKAITGAGVEEALWASVLLGYNKRTAHDGFLIIHEERNPYTSTLTLMKSDFQFGIFHDCLNVKYWLKMEDR